MKHIDVEVYPGRPFWRFPRLYAAASLKPLGGELVPRVDLGFPRLYAAASLKRGHQDVGTTTTTHVFRGFMPRPH